MARILYTEGMRNGGLGAYFKLQMEDHQTHLLKKSCSDPLTMVCPGLRIPRML